MWFLGVITGLVLGGMLGSGMLALVLAIIGGIVFNALWGRNKDDAAKPDVGSDTGREPVSDQPTLTQRVTDLEARVLALEAELQGLRSRESVVAFTTAPAQAALVESAVDFKTPEALAAAMPATTVQQVHEPMPATAANAEPEGPDTVPMAYPAQEAFQASEVAEPTKTWRERLPAPLANFLFGSNSLVRLGVLVLFLGLAFLLRYAAERVTVPVELRYVAVALVGLGLLALGWMLRRRRTDYAQILQGAGVAVIYLTTLAGMKWHGLIPPTAGFVFLAAVAVLAAMLAVLQNAYALAVVAALGGFAAPVLASTGSGEPLPLFTYLALLDAGIFLIAWFRAWRGLNLTGFVGTAMLAGAWVDRYYAPQHDGVLQVFLIFFFLLFTAVGLLFARRSLTAAPPDAAASLGERARQSVMAVGRVDSALAFGVPMVVFGLEYGLTRQWEFGPAIAALAFAFFYLALARWVMALDRRGLSLLAEAYVVIAVIFLTLSIPLALEGLWTGAAWAVEGAGMYWLGLRQQRPYARALAYVVMAGASWKLLQDTGFSTEMYGNLLEGSVLGPVLLSASAFVMWGMHRHAQLPRDDQPSLLADWESFAAGLMPWLGWAALTLLAWQCWPPQAAAAATAGLALIAFLLGVTRGWPEFQPIVLGLQGLALLSFLFTLHRVHGAGAAQPLLDNDAHGMGYALSIAVSMMLTSGWRMVAIRQRAMAEQLAPAWSMSSSVVLILAVLLLHLSTLFAVGLADAAWLWPITALAVLGVALRMAHTALAVVALALQLLSAVLHLTAPVPGAAQALDVFANADFGRALSLGACGLLAAWWLSLAARRVHAGERWACPWTARQAALWWPLLWGLVWWLSAWLIETSAYAGMPAGPGVSAMPALHGLVVLATSALLAGMALVLGWRQAGVTTAATLPGLVLVVLEFMARLGTDFVPSAHWGAWLWPLALVWYFMLLRRQAEWLPSSTTRALHVAGFWLFLLLAARECQWRLGGDAGVAHSWAMLGWALVPALTLVVLRRGWLARFWPLNEFGELYRETACIPVALYLLAWLWVGNLVGAGHAAPLPYVPFINPLELAQWLVFFALVLWWRDASDPLRAALPSKFVPAGLALTALALLTGTVLRTCHHYAGVDWSAQAMLHSRLAQASLSVVWALCAVAIMVGSNRLQARQVWLAGAALMGVVVAKLFMVDLADRGGLYRIISFIAVGMLLLLVGYFAPVPPVAKPADGPVDGGR